jgi:CheY-like chemotaxis protein
VKREVVILIAEDEESHKVLIQRNLRRAGIGNEQVVFNNGQEVLDFLFVRGEGRKRLHGTPYLLLLDIQMPKVDGIEVLRQIKSDPELRKVPVIMITATDDPREIEHCHALGCSSYVAKPVDYDKFVEAIRTLGLYLLVVEIPRVNGEKLLLL